MDKSFVAQIEGWSEKAMRNSDLVMKDAAQDVIGQMTETQPSAAEGGGQEGYVPVDTGVLIGSQVAAINGAVTGRGADIEYSLAIAAARPGDSILAGFTADYAVYVENGTSRFRGRYFMRNAALGWVAAVRRSAAKFKG